MPVLPVRARIVAQTAASWHEARAQDQRMEAIYLFNFKYLDNHLEPITQAGPFQLDGFVWERISFRF